jgi:peptide subunit release factor 1 (eRF1)
MLVTDVKEGQMSVVNHAIDEYTPSTLLKALREPPPLGGKVLSVYLDTSPDRQVAHAWLLDYRDRCKVVRAQLPDAEREPFERAAQQTEHFLTSDRTFHQPGLAIFASGFPSYFYVIPLPHRPPEMLTWDIRPQIETLHLILDNAERFAVALFDSERARLFTIYLGQIEEHEVIRDDVPRKQKSGGWATLSQTNFARHHDDHLRRHARHTATALANLLERHPYDRLLLGGPPEPLATLRHELPRALRARLAGTLHLELFRDDEAVRQAALEAVAKCERETEMQLVDELLDAAGTERVALGIAETLAAVNEGRVHVLFVAAGLGLIGGECSACSNLVAGLGPCPACGSAVAALTDLDERATERALAQGARVEVVSGDAADRLRGSGGLGAWVRWSPPSPG